jgi:hypothetical protein
VDTAFSNPFLFISADWPESKEDLNSHAYINKSRSDFYEARIQGTGHSNFMDIPFMIPYKMLSEAGDIQPKEGIEITNNLVLRFFDRHLKNISADIESIQNEYDKVTIKTYKAPLGKK